MKLCNDARWAAPGLGREASAGIQHYSSQDESARGSYRDEAQRKQMDPFCKVAEVAQEEKPVQG